MSERNDGGLAFPLGCPEMAIAGQKVKETQGMTLRDYFAGKALPECLKEFYLFLHEGNQCPEDWRKGVALDAYAMADAMLKARDANHG